MREYFITFGGTEANRKLEQINSTFEKTVKENMMKIVNSNSSYVKGVQSIEINGLKCGGDLNLSDVKNKSVINYDLESIMESISTNDFEATLEKSVKQAAENNQEVKSEFLSSSASTESDVQQINDVAKILSESVSLEEIKETVMQIENEQEINISNIEVGGDCDLDDLTQDLKIDVLVSEIAKRLTESYVKNFTDLDLDAEDKNEQDAESKGLGSLIKDLFGSFTKPLLYGFLGFIFLIIIIVLAIAFGGGSDDEKPMQSNYQPMRFPQQNTSQYSQAPQRFQQMPQNFQQAPPGFQQNQQMPQNFQQAPQGFQQNQQMPQNFQ